MRQFADAIHDVNAGLVPLAKNAGPVGDERDARCDRVHADLVRQGEDAAILERDPGLVNAVRDMAAAPAEGRPSGRERLLTGKRGDRVVIRIYDLHGQ